MPLCGPACKIARFQGGLKFPSWTRVWQKDGRKKEKNSQILTVTVTFVQASFVLVTFVQIRNISSVTDPTLTKLYTNFFWPNFFGPESFEPKIFGAHPIFLVSKLFWTQIFGLNTKFVWTQFFPFNFYGLKILFLTKYLTYWPYIVLLKLQKCNPKKK